MRLQTSEGSLDRIVCGFDVHKTALCLSIPVKRASNLLRWLHQRGFLKRKRTKRLCVPSFGKSCYRGYKYVYSFSKQGVRYLRWLSESRPLEDALYARLTYDVVSNLPEDLRHTLGMLSLCRETMKYRGPTRYLRLFENNAIPVINLSIQNQQFAEENKKLLIDNCVLQYQLDQIKKELEQSKQRENMLYQNWAATLVEASRIMNEMNYWKAKADEYPVALEVAKGIIQEMRRFSEEKFEQYRALAQARHPRNPTIYKAPD